MSGGTAYGWNRVPWVSLGPLIVAAIALAAVRVVPTRVGATS
jgi:hypothetical protein